MAPCLEPRAQQQQASQAHPATETIDSKERSVEDDQSHKRQRTTYQEENSIHSSWPALDNFIFNWLEQTNNPRRRRHPSEPLPSLCVHALKRKAMTEPMDRGRNGSTGHGRDTSSSTGRSSTPASMAMSPSRYYGHSNPSRTPSASSARSLVGLSNYRQDHLEKNGVYITRWNTVPERERNLAQSMNRNRESPEPSCDDIYNSQGWKEMDEGCDESALARYFEKAVQNSDDYDGMKVSHNTLMCGDWVPSNTTSFRISQPKPDSLYGYKLSTFEQHHKLSLSDMHKSLRSNNDNLILPFLTIEYKGDGPVSHGSIWAAENQCFGASAASINVAAKLNEALAEAARYPGPVQRLDSAVFSVAMDNHSATLFISWQTDLNVFSSRVKSFAMLEPDHFIEFRRYVRNIVDWGMNKRLENIRGCLDVLIEEKRLQAASKVKNRSPSP